MAEGSDRSDEIRSAGQDEDVEVAPPAVSEELKERARRGDEVAAARVEVEQTRAEITETVEAIQEKLEPQNLGEQAKGRATYAARAKGQQLFEAVKQNPMPAAVVGGVICLLLVRRLRGRG